MKYIKSYENSIEGQPQIGDYVLCVDKESDDIGLQEFIKNTIGILEIIYDRDSSNYSVYYKNLPERFNITYSKDEDNRIVFSRYEIIHYSKNIEDVESYIQSNKYNL